MVYRLTERRLRGSSESVRCRGENSLSDGFDANNSGDCCNIEFDSSRDESSIIRGDARPATVYSANNGIVKRLLLDSIASLFLGSQLTPIPEISDEDSEQNWVEYIMATMRDRYERVGAVPSTSRRMVGFDDWSRARESSDINEVCEERVSEANFWVCVPTSIIGTMIFPNHCGRLAIKTLVRKGM